MKRLSAAIALCAFAALFAMGQKFSPSASEIVESATPPTSPRPGPKPWMKTAGAKVFYYSRTYGAWCGPPQNAIFSKTGAATTGALNFGANCASDTTTDAQSGLTALGKIVIDRVHGISKNGLAASPNCSTYVFANQTLLGILTWSGNYNDWTPNLSVDSGAVVSFFLKPKSSGAVNPNTPVMEVIYHEQVAAP